MPFILPLLFFFFFFFLLLHTNTAQPLPRVPWRRKAAFVFDPSISDEFNGKSLDTKKWDPHGTSNPDTNCPAWNGPAQLKHPGWATYFPTLTDPRTRLPSVRQYVVRNGYLQFHTSSKPLTFFLQREYYCNTTTFKCNSDGTTDCFATNAHGFPSYRDRARTKYLGVSHDKCKIEPYCIPHPYYVTGQRRIYTRLVGAHISSRATVKYGMYEVKVGVGKSSAVGAAWMHGDTTTNGFCRFVKSTTPRRKLFLALECPSKTRSRRWQEIDIVEAMNSKIYKRRYIPNIHAFAGYKGEFTSVHSVDRADGRMGGGPILIEGAIFNQPNPSFADIPYRAKKSNDWHFNAGSQHELDTDWSAKTRVLGMYWSASEIRFYVDGKEVSRIRNTMIHQPMVFDLAYSFNVEWAKETPSDAEIKQVFRVFYVRRWTVFTRNGLDPPSSVRLNQRMTRFRNRYGNKLYGIFKRFPVHDKNDKKTFKQLQHRRKGTFNAKRLASLKAQNRKWRRKNAAALRRNAALRKKRGVKALRGQSIRIEEELESEGNLFNLDDSDYFVNASGWTALASGVRMLNMSGGSELCKGDVYKTAGGTGNRRFWRQRRKLSERERTIALSHPNRVAKVLSDGMRAEIMQQAEVTVFDSANPNRNGAGWATTNGYGNDDSLG